MYISINEGLYIIEEIRKQINNVNQSYHINIGFSLEQQINIMDVYRTCIEELLSKNYEVDEFVKIASLSNAISIFSFTENKKINTEIIVSVLLEMTSKVNDEISIEHCVAIN